RLRNGKTPRTIGSSQAILVTHNYSLFCASARFFNQRRNGRTVPHCVYDSAFTTLVWLHEPRRYPNLPRELVLANAAAALRPSEDLWRRYNATIQMLYERGAIDAEDMRFLRVSEDANGLLMNLTRGDPGAFTEATVIELLNLYRERAVKAVKDEMDSELRVATDRFTEE